MRGAFTAISLLPAKGGGRGGGGGRGRGGRGGGGWSWVPGDNDTIIVCAVVFGLLLILSIWLYLSLRRSRAKRANQTDAPPRPDTLGTVPPALRERNTRHIAASSPAPSTLPPTRGAGPAQAEAFHVTPVRTLAVPLPAPPDDGHDAAATSPIVPVVPAVSPTALTVTDPPRPER